VFEGINWVGVALAVVAAFILGALWFGPLFSKAWLRELGTTQERMAGGPPLAPILGMQLVATIITAIVLAIIIERFGNGIGVGATIGVMCAAGFVATAKLGDVLFSRTATSKRFYIEAGNQLVSYALMGAIYGAFA
jgi:hypothetical protein